MILFSKQQTKLLAMRFPMFCKFFSNYVQYTEKQSRFIHIGYPMHRSEEAPDCAEGLPPSVL
jgi:hypothetical protein